MKRTKYIVVDDTFIDFTFIHLCYFAFDTEQEALEDKYKMIRKRDIERGNHKPYLIKIETVRELTKEEIDAYI